MPVFFLCSSLTYTFFYFWGNKDETTGYSCTGNHGDPAPRLFCWERKRIHNQDGGNGETMKMERRQVAMENYVAAMEKQHKKKIGELESKIPGL